MSSLRPHEEWKKTVARLFELFAVQRDVPLYAYGSTTFKSAARERGVEPGECYCVDAPTREWPQIVLEVVDTHPFAVDRGRIYEGLGCPELFGSAVMSTASNVDLDVAVAGSLTATATHGDHVAVHVAVHVNVAVNDRGRAL